MCKRFLVTATAAAALAIACSGIYSKCDAQLISSFEKNLTSSVGATWEGDGILAGDYVSTGATDGTSAIAIHHGTGWAIQAVLKGGLQLAQAASTHDFLLMDVTTSDLGVAGDGWSPAWRQVFVVFNSNQGGWQQNQVDIPVASDDGGSLTSPLILDLVATGIKANAQAFVAAGPGEGKYWELFLPMQGGDQGIPALKAGDYGPPDSVVNAADYVTWRDSLNGTTLTNETVSPGIVDAADYQEWRAHFGTDYAKITTIFDNVRFANAGSGAGSASAAPEPSSAILVIVGSLVVGLSRRLRK